mmetsp:Transcript_70278/g.139358  ORF Transcript_70278/g.139358 Transcript_70278/m.139358 type:complete len:103 (-) Transcript_70278:149-457(-)
MRQGGQLFVGCFSDANPDPWTNPRRLSEQQIRTLFCEERGWRIVEMRETWYERPSGQIVSRQAVLARSIALMFRAGRPVLSIEAFARGGAWTMAWWLTAEVV